MRFLLPQGIGDSVWAMHKIRSVAEREHADCIDVSLNCSDATPIQSRSQEFIKKFDFVNYSNMLVTTIHPDAGWVDSNGRYVYIDSGWREINGSKYFALMPNGSLERGIRLEDWLPQYDIDWNTASHFKFTEEELEFGRLIRKSAGEFVMFYLGPIAGNTFEGHNRGPMWTPEDWLILSKRLRIELGLRVVVVGAEYDYSYYGAYVEPILGPEDDWMNLIGKTSVGMLYAVAKQARFVISYQSGVGIFSSYLGIPTGIFWRPKGNSINASFFLSFEEAMASAWTKPEMIESGKHLPLIYGRHGVDYIVESIKERKW